MKHIRTTKLYLKENKLYEIEDGDNKTVVIFYVSSRKCLHSEPITYTRGRGYPRICNSASNDTDYSYLYECYTLDSYDVDEDGYVKSGSSIFKRIRLIN